MAKTSSNNVQTSTSVGTIPLAPSVEETCGTDPAWYTPARLLMAFCVVSFLVFLDRGIIASNGVNGDKDSRTGIQGEFQLSKFQDGVLPAAFMVGLLVASLVFSELCKHYNAFRLIGWGMGIFMVSSVGCGLANSFWTLLACRIVMGAGEASIINLTGPFIDDVAPPDRKTLWFGILYLFPTVGIAGGYIFGGVIGASMGWRVPFLIQAGHELFGVGRESIDLTFGGVTIVTAVIATLLGGWVLDRVGSSIKNAMLMNGWSAVVGFIAIVAAFWLPPATSTGFVWFMAIFALGELAIFAGTAPSGAVTVWSVPTRLRPLASGIAAIASHILGDVPTPPLVGLLQGYVQDWRISMLILTLILIVAAVLFFTGSHVQSTDYRPEEERSSLEKGHRLTATNAGNVGPLASDMETATLIHNHGDIAEGSHV